MIILIRGKLKSGKSYLRDFIISNFYKKHHFVSLEFKNNIKYNDDLYIDRIIKNRYIFTNYVIEEIKNSNIQNTIFIISNFIFISDEFSTLLEELSNHKFLILNKLNKDFETLKYEIYENIKILDVEYINDKNLMNIKFLLYKYIFE